MAIISDLQVKFVGNEVHFLSGAGKSRTLQPHGFYDVVGEVVGGIITISVESLDFHQPSVLRPVGPHVDPDDPDGEGPGSVQEIFNCVATKVELFRGDETRPVETFQTKNGKQLESQSRFQFDAGPIAGPLSTPRTKFRLRVTNTSSKVVKSAGGMEFVRDREAIGQTRVPFRVLNHAFDVVLDALAPRARISGGILHLSFGSELARTFELEGLPFGEQAIPIDLPVDVTGELISVAAEVVTGAAVLEAAGERLGRIRDTLEAELTRPTPKPPGTVAGLRAAIAEIDQQLADLRETFKPDLVAVHISALASTLDLEARVIPGFEFDLGAVEDLAVNIYLAFEPAASRGGGSGHVLVVSPADFTGVAELAADLGIIPEAGRLIEQLLTPELQKRIPAIHRFFAEVLGRMSAFLGDVPAIFIDARSVTDTSLIDEKGTSILVRWTSDPAARRTTTPTLAVGRIGLVHAPTADTGPVRAPTEGMVPVHANPGRHGGVGGPLRGGSGSTADPGSGVPVERGPRGAMPSGFLVGDPQSVARLDRIDTIVVLMMENRSFDHLLGSLRQLNTKYDGLTGSEKNTVVERGQTRTVRMVRAENAVAPPITQIPVSPHHSFDHVKAQIADGAMSGFAADLLPIGDPQLALTFYTENDIPNHYQLAQSHMVCDQWFAAHPGPTYPNRWATLEGAIPGLNNLDIDAPQLGFMRDPTIFDLLTEEGISWNYFENNVSMLRMYGRYRLDNVNVLPYDDPEEGFEHKAAAGALPSVVFVDPRFTGIPPLRQASDDHPPADLRVGQQLIARVYNALVHSPHWDRLLFVITYDEHGGFFDHVPPPGTALGPAELRGKIPRLHPDGADSMGARVPTFIISPFVNQGDVSHVVFDHTSILKTILVRHRNRFFSDQFRRFSNHVFMINHLGAALNRDTPRPEPPVLLPEPPRRQRPTLQDAAVPRVRRRPTEMPADGDRSDFGVSLARAMLPKHA